MVVSCHYKLIAISPRPVPHRPMTMKGAGRGSVKDSASGRTEADNWLQNNND